MPDVNPVPNVLAVRFSSIGDVLLITPLLRAIRWKYPAARITVLTKQAHASLLSHNPHLNRVISLDPGQRIPELARSSERSGTAIFWICTTVSEADYSRL